MALGEDDDKFLHVVVGADSQGKRVEGGEEGKEGVDDGDVTVDEFEVPNAREGGGGEAQKRGRERLGENIEAEEGEGWVGRLEEESEGFVRYGCSGVYVEIREAECRSASWERTGKGRSMVRERRSACQYTKFVNMCS